MFNHKLKPILLSLSVLIMSFLVGYFIFAWQEPSLSPPEGNVPTPINVGAEPQAKTGRISATEFGDSNNPSYFLNPEGNSLLGGMTETNTLGLTPRSQPATPQEGQFYFDSELHTLCYYNGSEWICLGEAEVPPGICADWPTQTDDPRCEVVDCDGKDSYYDDGPDSPSGTNYCVFVDYQDITTDRCKGVGQCKTSDDCTNPTETRVDTCGPCEYCNGSSCANYAYGTSCGDCKSCDGNGNCSITASNCTGCSGGRVCWGGYCRDNHYRNWNIATGKTCNQYCAEQGGRHCSGITANNDNCGKYFSIGCAMASGNCGTPMSPDGGKCVDFATRCTLCECNYCGNDVWCD